MISHVLTKSCESTRVNCDIIYCKVIEIWSHLDHSNVTVMTHIHLDITVHRHVILLFYIHCALTVSVCFNRDCGNELLWKW